MQRIHRDSNTLLRIGSAFEHMISYKSESKVKLVTAQTTPALPILWHSLGRDCSNFNQGCMPRIDSIKRPEVNRASPRVFRALVSHLSHNCNSKSRSSRFPTPAAIYAIVAIHVSDTLNNTSKTCRTRACIDSLTRRPRSDRDIKVPSSPEGAHSH
jgi:hypothetical protein